MSKPRRASARKVPDDAALAWALAEAAEQHLSSLESHRIYIAIGVGETFTAIDALITAIVRDGIALGDDLVATVTAWLDCYVGQDAEPRLRELLAGTKILPPQRASATSALRRYLPLAAEYRHPRSS